VLTAPHANPAFDVYPDTRSQEYGGIGAQAPSTNAAESATRGQVVEYGGRPAITYFFSSSGGHTESVQDAFPGTTPEPWLVGVADPYDDSGGNPYYRWNETLSLDQAAHVLGGLVKGRFEGIRVLQHGASPRIVTAAVVGTGGSTDVTGARLRDLFGLRSTYVSFTTITVRSIIRRTSVPPPHGGSAPKPRGSSEPSTTSSSGGAGLGTGSAGATGPAGSRTDRGGGVLRSGHTLEGTAFPAGSGSVVAQRLERVGWRDAGRAEVTRAGSYAIEVAHPGLYRVVYRGIDGPSVGVK
jgi:stage II sporulation protein D